MAVDQFSGLFALRDHNNYDLFIGVRNLPARSGVIMPRYVIKLEKHGSQVRVTIPKEIVGDLGLKRMAYALCWTAEGKSFVVTPFIDEVMLNAAISRDPDLRDPRSQKP